MFRHAPFMLALALLFLLPPSPTAAARPAHPRLAEAEKALAANDATGAKIALNLLAEETRDPALRRQAKHMMDTALPVAEAGKYLQRGELFLVEPTLRAVEKRLGRSASDVELKARIAALRQQADALHAQLRREDTWTALAARKLLETEKFYAGDYPLTRADAERLLLPALKTDGNKYRLQDWQPTLRGYRLVLQNTRSGDNVEVTPD